MKKITIGITDCSKYSNYEKWILAEPGIQVIKLSYHENNWEDIKYCQGILLTGGEDVHPKFYGKPEFEKTCHTLELQRDEFEWKVLTYSQENLLPLLGICRGLQLVNVFFGGTLMPDIVSSRKSDHSKIGLTDRYHNVHIEEDSILHEYVGIEEGIINSAHHQCADIPGNGLKINAVSDDGIIEGLERKERMPYLMLVQWHPERMNDQETSLSKNIKRSFLDAVNNNGIKNDENADRKSGHGRNH